MRALDIELFRDLIRFWAQALAISLVIAGAAATLVLAVGSIRSLVETRDAYYERNQFADVFALVKRAPKQLIDQIADIPGVAAAEARIVKLALLDIPDSREPVTAEFISLPDISEQRLNRIYLTSGRVPEPGKAEEVVAYEGFAAAHDMHLGSRFSAIVPRQKSNTARSHAGNAQEGQGGRRWPVPGKRRNPPHRCSLPGQGRGFFPS